MVEKRFQTLEQKLLFFPPSPEIVGEGDKVKTFMVSRNSEGVILFSINADYFPRQANKNE